MAASYIGQLSDEQAISIFEGILGGKVSLVGRGGEGLSLRCHSSVSDGVETFEVSDFYEVGDYHIASYDCNIGEEDVFAFRSAMLEIFGDAYAKDFLLSCHPFEEF